MEPWRWLGGRNSSNTSIMQIQLHDGTSTKAGVDHHRWLVEEELLYHLHRAFDCKMVTIVDGR
jgi:hypothetical protein